MGIGGMMPIRPENRHRYPKDWPTITASIRRRAGDRCECLGECQRGTHDGRCPNINGGAAYGTGSTVYLTVAHLNHTPEDCRPENLRAMCQGCHLHYDRDHHAETRRRTNDAKLRASGQQELPLWAGQVQHPVDMPPLWDGMPVEWTPWEDQAPTLLCGPPGRVDGTLRTCERCGWQRRQFAYSRGVVRVAHGLATIRLGNLGDKTAIVAVLYAKRCLNCETTYVLDGPDKNANEWILDESDYTPEGSWES